MQRNKEKIHEIDVDKAWNIVYTRLEKDILLAEDTDLSSRRKLFKYVRWAAVATAAACIGLIISNVYFPKDKDDTLIFLQNKDNSGALVTTFEDGSTVYLANNASIFYPDCFAKNKRKVELRGNALFYVTKDEKRPFIVETKENITIEVVGTIFAVQSTSGTPFELSVKEGKVNIHSKDNKNVVPLVAGETVRMESSGLNKSETVNFSVFNYFTERMCFKDEKLNNIINAINSMYGFPNLTTDESINDRLLTVTFENESVESMTELICMALNLEYVNKQDTIYIRKFIK